MSKAAKLAINQTTALMMFVDVQRQRSETERTVDQCFEEFRRAYDLSEQDYPYSSMKSDYNRILKRQAKS